MLTLRWRGGPVWGTPASVSPERRRRTFSPNRDGRSTAGPSTADGGARYGHPPGQSPARSGARVSHPGDGLRGAGNSIREVEQFFKMGPRPKPRAGTAGDGFGGRSWFLVGFGFGLVWWLVLVWVGFGDWFGWSYGWIWFGWIWLVLVGSSFLGNQFYWLNLGWPEFCTPAKMT